MRQTNKPIVMKKIILVMALALMAFTAKAQLYVGGSLGLNSVANPGGAATAVINIVPEVGYNLNDNMAVGGVIGWSNDGTVEGFLNDSGFSVMPYFRYFFYEMGSVRVFADAQLQLLFVTNANNNPATTSSFGVGVAPGIAIPVTDHLSFVGHLGSVGYYNGAFGVNLNLNNFAAGVYYAF